MTRTDHGAMIDRPGLEARARSLVLALDGRWNGDRGMCRCPAHPDHTPSLSIRVGDRALLFKCFAGCSTGRVLRSIAAFDPALPHLRTATPARPQDGRWVRERIAALWREASPISDTPAEAYLASRGLVTRSPALRYHARTPIKIGRLLSFRPAMLAAVRDGHRIVAVQRTFLDPERGALVADLMHRRRLFGRPGSGAVILAEPAPMLGIAEGVETALAAMQILGMPVWATLGAERFDRVRIPEIVERLVLLPDADNAGARACDRAIAAYACAHLTIEARRPPPPAKDWNDALHIAPASPCED